MPQANELRRIRVLIADDQHLFAESLKFILEGESGGEIEVAAIAEDGKQAVAMAETARPDIVLMDVRMPVMDGVKATSIIRRLHPEAKILMLTTFDDDELVYEALHAGARGYVLKSIDPKELLDSIKAVHSGSFCLSSSIGLKLVDIMAGETERIREDATVAAMSGSSGLSRREAEILLHVGRGKRNQDIADVLCISEKTVRNHLSSIYFKLNMHNRLQLITHVSRLLRSTASVDRIS